MQTILGAGGAIGGELAKVLSSYTAKVRLVGRRPEKVNETDELIAADLLNRDDTLRAVAGSEVVYLTAGLPYNAAVWETAWPKLMSNVIHACREYGSRLVFFDNVYMYDRNHLKGMTEQTPVHPSSRKGRVRASVVRMIMDEVEKGGLTALIARSADFYGSEKQKTSVLSEMVIKPLNDGKKAIWMGSARYVHSFTYVPDAAKATALLGNTADAWNQVWHLPTAPNPYMGKEWIELVAGQLRRPARQVSIPGWMMRISGLFVPLMKELAEMVYQYDRDYVFDSSKFENRFRLAATPYPIGIRHAVQACRKSMTPKNENEKAGSALN